MVILLIMCWCFSGKLVFVKVSMNVVIGNLISVVCKKS